MYVLGIDIGTTGAKAMLVNEQGEILGSAYKAYELIKPGKGYVEQRADDWWDAFVVTVKDCIRSIKDKNNILAVSVSSQGGSLVPVDKKGCPLCNVLVWMDKRGLGQQNELLKINSNDFYYRKSGWKLSPGLNLVKIRWMKDMENDIYNAAYKFISTIDYMNFKLTGRYIIDPSNAAMTQLMDIQSGKWDGQILDLIGIHSDRLSEIVQSGSLIGNLTPDAAGQLGLNTAVQVISGGHDQYCAAVGAGAIHKGDMLLSTGTAWVVLGISDIPLFEAGTYLAPGPHIINGLWGALASIPTAGVAMEWFRHNFALRLQNSGEYDTESFKDIDDKASLLMEKARDVFFYPYYNGSGFPRWSLRSKASLFGLGLEHDRYDIARAIMEGVAFEVGGVLEEYKKGGCDVNNLRVLGGASQSGLWTDIIANVVDCDIIRFKEAHIACVGAAIVAGVGCGLFSNCQDGYDRFSNAEIYTASDSAKKEFYREKYRKYKLGIDLVEDYYKKIL